MNENVRFAHRISDDHRVFDALGFAFSGFAWTILQIIFVGTIVKQLHSSQLKMSQRIIVRLGLTSQVIGFGILAYGFQIATYAYWQLSTPSLPFGPEILLDVTRASNKYMAIGGGICLLGECLKCWVWIFRDRNIPTRSESAGRWIRIVCYVIFGLNSLLFIWLSLFGVEVLRQLNSLGSGRFVNQADALLGTRVVFAPLMWSMHVGIFTVLSSLCCLCASMFVFRANKKISVN